MTIKSEDGDGKIIRRVFQPTKVEITTPPKRIIVDAATVQHATEARFKTVNNTLVKAARQYCRAVNLKSWAEFTQITQLPAPPHLASKPIDSLIVTEALDYLEKHGATFLEAIRKAEKEIVKAEAPVYTSKGLEINFADGSRLLPRQQKAVERCIELFLEWFANKQGAKYAGCAFPLEAGEGKSYIETAFSMWLQQNGYLGKTKIEQYLASFILTPASVVLKTEAKFAQLGAVNIGTQIKIGSHQMLSSKAMSGMYRIEEIMLFNNRTKVWKWNGKAPVHVNWDESHLLKKMHSMRTQKGLAWADGNTFTTLTSATIGGTLQDMTFPSLVFRPYYMGKHLNRTTVSMFLHEINGRSGIPLHKPNAAAMSRYREEMKEVFIYPPKDKRTVKARNRVMLIDFEDDNHRRNYIEAEERWLEAKRRAGEEPSEFGQVMAMYQILRQAGEICSVPTWCRFYDASIKKGLAPVIGVSYQEVLRDMKIKLVTEYGYDPNSIAVIWGGSQIVKPEELLSDKEMFDILKLRTKDREAYENLDRKLLSRYKKTMKHNKDRWRRELSPAEMLERNAWLKKLGLDRQTPAERFAENQAFLRGEKTGCLFTLPAGGTGIDLDHQYDSAKPRVGFFTICYYAEEFMQALCRTMRAATKTNVDQYMCFLRGTLAHMHVAPKLDRKLASIHRLCTGSEDYMAELMKPHVAHDSRLLVEKFRTEDEIMLEEPEVYGDDADTEEEEDENGEE